jgi:hypothetical protein
MNKGESKGGAFVSRTSTYPFVLFSLIIQGDFQLEWLLKHGNGGCIVVDGTANTQKYKVKSFYTLNTNLLLFL